MLGVYLPYQTSLGRVLTTSLQYPNPPIPRNTNIPNTSAAHIGNPVKNRNAPVPAAAVSPLIGNAMLSTFAHAHKKQEPRVWAA